MSIAAFLNEVKCSTPLQTETGIVDRQFIITFRKLKVMRLTIKPVEIPFTIGATVWVNQACGIRSEYPYFQAIIVQIILDGTLTNSIVIRHPGNTHELLISSGIYDLKPIGAYSKLKRITATVEFLTPQKMLFQTEGELIAYTTNRSIHPDID